MAWFGIVRDDEAIASWQRADALRRSGVDPQRRVAERVGRWLGLPLLATTATVLAVIPGTIVPPTTAAPVRVLVVEPLADAGDGSGAILLRMEGHDPEARSSSAGQDDRVAAPATTVDAATAAAAVAVLRISGPVGPAGAVGASGIPVTLLAAYRAAEKSLAASDPACHLPWWLLAGIGRIESGHASGGRVTADGTTRGRILGPRLDGSLAGTAVITDSDGGTLDGDPAYDRAVGPMQFLPGTWRSWGRDGNGDGVKDPSNVYDASLAAGAYLCAGGRDLSTDAGIASAVLSYNYSQSYLDSVVSWGVAYRDGVTPTDDSAGSIAPSATTRPTTSTTSTTSTSTSTTTTPTSTPTTPTTGRPTSSSSPTTRPPTPTTTSSTGSPTTSPTTPATCPSGASGPSGTTTSATTSSASTTSPTTSTTTSTPSTTTTGPGCPNPTSSTSSTSPTSSSTSSTSSTSTSTGSLSP